MRLQQENMWDHYHEYDESQFVYVCSYCRGNGLSVSSNEKTKANKWDLCGSCKGTGYPVSPDLGR